jgi:SCF-associated factor 1
MYGVPETPVVSLQCGGWHTSLLTSSGIIYAVGKLCGSFFSTSPNSAFLKPLEWPQYLPATPKVYQFSAGREHILGLADDGKVWFWNNINKPAYQIVFDIFEIPFLRQVEASNEGVRSWDPTSISTVVAGWSKSSAFIRNEGIVVWEPDLRRGNLGAGPTQDRPVNLMISTMQIPRTAYKRPTGQAREPSLYAKELGETVGEVVKWVILDAYVVLLTDLGKVFAANISEFTPHATSKDLIELTGFEPSNGKGKMIDIQGSFRNFAVFNADGDVVLAEHGVLDFQWSEHDQPTSSTPAQAQHSNTNIVESRRPAALQNRGVIALAFGDYHLHALTAEGHVLSFGHEPQACGCLGLGGHYEGAFLRGVVLAAQHSRDNVINEGVRDDGLRVWFSPEQREWLLEMRRASMKNTLAPIPSGREQAWLSRYFEKQGADWDLHPSVDNGLDEKWGQGQPAYFTLAITAAGWHSAALVLVNEARTEKLYKQHKGFLPPGPDTWMTPARSLASSSNVSRTGNTAPASSPWDALTNISRRINGLIFGEEVEDEKQRIPSHVLAAEDQAKRMQHDWYHQSSWSGDEYLPEAAKHGITMPRIPPQGLDGPTHD